MMRVVQRIFFFSVILVCLGIVSLSAIAQTDQRNSKQDQDEVASTAEVFDLRENTESNVHFRTSNYGIFGLNPSDLRSQCIWPRGSENNYIFGGGLWFGARKRHNGEVETYVEVTYNSMSGRSWMIPGRIEDGPELQQDPNLRAKYAIQSSLDYNEDGGPLDTTCPMNWPLWDTDPNASLQKDRYLGAYVNDPSQRNKETYPKGPAYISDEDFFCVFKDTDISSYEGSPQMLEQKGYPLMLQYEQTIYSWKSEGYQDFIILHYNIMNFSSDTLSNCYVAPIYDVDLMGIIQGGQNDRTRFYEEDLDLNLAVAWTDTDLGEANAGFGYIGFDLLETPAVDDLGLLRRDKKVYSQEEQLGITTFRNIDIASAPSSDETRYSFMSAFSIAGDTGPGDKTLVMATGPFYVTPW